MRVEYRVSEDDYRFAALLALKKRSFLSAADYYGPYAVAIIWIGGSVIPNPLNGYLTQEFDVLLTLGVVPILVLYMWMRIRKIRREYARLRNIHWLRSLDLDAIGLRLKTSDGVTRSSWEMYTKFAEDKWSFILFRKGEHDIMPIPKSHLTPLQAIELRSLLAAHLPGKGLSI